MMTLPKPDFSDVAYGPDPRHRLDVWKAEGAKTPLVVFIHGGGWKGGDKREHLGKPYARPARDKLLRAGVSLASINYRYTSAESPLPSPQMDAVHAVQFLRSQAGVWGLDKTRFAACGGSAGGCLALYLALHDDFADPRSADPVGRESSRLACVAAVDAQSSIYPPQVEAWVGPEALRHKMIYSAFGDRSFEDARLGDCATVYLEASPITHLDAAAPPVFLSYTRADTTVPAKDPKHGIHHPVFGIKLHKAMHQVGQTCWLQIGERGLSNTASYDDYADFLIDQLTSMDVAESYV